MAVRVGINGFGRIGRLVFRVLASRPAEFEVAAINDLSNPATLKQLLKYDSVHGRFRGTVESTEKSLIVNGKEIQVLSERAPANLPWGKLGVQVALESTGVFTKRSSEKGGYGDHLKAGAKKVILSAPASDEPDLMVVLGVNDDKLSASQTCLSNASCTTNCLAPVAKVLNDSFGLVEGLMTTVHAYTNDQNVADLVHKDPRRARAAAVNIIPTTTGAARAVGKVIPELNGKLNGFALRVPVADGSIVDLVAMLKRSVTVAEVNAALKNAAEGKMRGILEYSEDPLVSSDIIGNPHSSIIDAQSTMTMPGAGGNMVKVVSWYDNEWGYACRTADLIARVAKLG
ncbi:MAG: type I glyceraldehyde-3-phosphate dehydrogenase [Phycisphaerales bacterium]|nr:type I glyceraldehyde-3-phosphate dehydrogenase [Phycisphaerales bacterium]